MKREETERDMYRDREARELEEEKEREKEKKKREWSKTQKNKYCALKSQN